MYNRKKLYKGEKNMFYVYEWYVVESGEIFYVGKGTRNRYKVRKHNKFFNDFITRYNCDSRIIKEFKTEKEAFEYEYERINELKCIGQCVCNIYKGGTDIWMKEEKYISSVTATRIPTPSAQRLLWQS